MGGRCLELGDEYDITDSVVSLAGIYHELELSEEARSHAESALTMSDNLDYTKAHIEALLQLASIEKTEGELDRATEHAHRAIKPAYQGRCCACAATPRRSSRGSPT